MAIAAVAIVESEMSLHVGQDFFLPQGQITIGKTLERAPIADSSVHFVSLSPRSFCFSNPSRTTLTAITRHRGDRTCFKKSSKSLEVGTVRLRPLVST